MSYSIIILNYNNSKDTITLVQRVLNFNGIDNIVIVDNNSSKEQHKQLSEFVLSTKNDKIILFETGSNFGYAKGNNIGLNILKKIGYDGATIVMNPDVIISEKSINRVVSLFEKIPSAILSPRMADGEKSWWNFTDYKETILTNFLHLKRKHHYVTKFSAINGVQQVDVLSGAFLAATMNTWEKIGGFDEHTFLYFEEEILQYKALSLGVKSFLVTNSEYRHIGGTSTNTDDKKNSIKKIMLHEWRIQKSREYYFLHYLHVSKTRLFCLRLLFFIHTPLVIIKRGLKK